MLQVTNSLDLLYFILAIAAVWIGVMLTWLLFEAALMAHRANRVVRETIEKIKRVERAVLSMKDRLENSASYLGILAEGGKTLMSYMQDKKGKSRRKKKNDDDDEDDE